MASKRKKASFKPRAKKTSPAAGLSSALSGTVAASTPTPRPPRKPTPKVAPFLAKPKRVVQPKIAPTLVVPAPAAAAAKAVIPVSPIVPEPAQSLTPFTDRAAALGGRPPIKSPRQRWMPVAYGTLFGAMITIVIGAFILALMNNKASPTIPIYSPALSTPSPIYTSPISASPSPSPIYPSPSPSGLLPAVGDAQHVGEPVPLQAESIISPPQKGTYTTDPPSSGPHYTGTDAAPWGFSDKPLAPEAYLDNLSRGGVVILYNCNPPSIGTPPSPCADTQAQIQHFIANAPRESAFSEVKLVSSTYAVQGHPIVLLAWGYHLYMDTFDPALAERFYEAHVDNGPTSKA